MEIDLLDTIADSREDLVRNGVEDIRKDGSWQVLAEDFYLVALVAVDASDVNHGDIHADIANIGSLLTINQAVAGTTAEVAVQTIGIADRNGGNHTVTCQYATARIAHRFVLGDMAQLKDGGL